MARFEVNKQGFEVSFEVSDKWLKNLKLNPFSPLEDQVYKLALSDPEKSGLTASDDAVKAVVEAAKELISCAKEINKKYPLAKVRATVADVKAGTFDVTVAGNVRDKALTKDAAKTALDEVEAFFAHTNLIHTGQVAVEKGDTPEKIAEAITIALNNAMKKGDARKIVAVYPIPGVDGTIFYNYVSKEAHDKLNSYHCDDEDCNEEDEEDEEDSEY